MAAAVGKGVKEVRTPKIVLFKRCIMGYRVP